MSKLSPTKTLWQWYRNLFSITILRYLVIWFSIVPILVSVYRNLPETAKITIDEVVYSFNLKFDLVLPFHWQLLWISSFFYVIALLLYYLTCPRFIKLYPSFSEYKKHLHSPRWIVWEAEEIINNKSTLPKLYERLEKKNYIRHTEPNEDIGEVIVKKNQTEITFNYEGVDKTLAFPPLNANEEEILSEEREIFWEIFGRYSESKKPIRYIIIILLIISAVFFICAFGQHILKGANYAIEFLSELIKSYI